MRLRLTLHCLQRNCSIGLSYSYYLSAAIYGWIEQSSAEYSTFLHDRGFPLEGSVRRFKHFCFSRLNVPQRRIVDGRLEIHSPVIEWFVAMPVEELLQHLVLGMFEKREFFIEREENRFAVEQVETMPEPEWRRRMAFRMLSPLTVSVPEDRYEGSLHQRSPDAEGNLHRNHRVIPHYLRPDDPRLAEALRSNILNKYASLYGSQPADAEFRCELDQIFIARRGGPEKVSKLITIKAGCSGETRVRGFMCPVTIEGNPELIKLAYESGLGEKGSLGFGMLEVL
ncbi:MAG: CRISPR-associated endoribonuclease Cas6 [Ignavibacteria bacterium]|nr:CRISPR-associated endoribonuclease Cas6 [Ignavibacteria bacterium]